MRVLVLIFPFLFVSPCLAVAAPRVPLPALDRSQAGGTALLYRVDAAGEHWELLEQRRLGAVPPGRAVPTGPALRIPAEGGAPAWEYPLAWPAFRRVEWADEQGRLHQRRLPVEERFVLVRVPGVPLTGAPPAPEESYEVELLLDSGPPEGRLDLVVMGDGYTQAEQGKLRDHAEQLVEGLFAAEPFASRRSSFNVHLVYLVSNESGADKVDAEQDADCETASFAVDTVLDCGFCAGGVQRAVACNERTFLSIMPVAVPDFDFGVVIVNAERPGGTGGLVPAFTPDAWFGEVVRHELGHYLGGLADEYESCLPVFEGYEWPPAPNVTESTVREEIPWADLIAPETPVPTFRHLNCNGIAEGDCGWDLNGRESFCLDTEGTPVDEAYWEAHAGAVGLFEGARYEHTGVFRPTAACMMRSLDAEFCPVCARELVRWIEYFAPPCVPTEELCDGLDNDCDGETDEGVCAPSEDVVLPDATVADVGEAPELLPEAGSAPDQGLATPDVQGGEDLVPPTPCGGGFGGCGAASGPGAPPLALLLLLLALAWSAGRQARLSGFPRRQARRLLLERGAPAPLVPAALRAAGLASTAGRRGAGAPRDPRR